MGGKSKNYSIVTLLSSNNYNFFRPILISAFDAIHMRLPQIAFCLDFPTLWVGAMSLMREALEKG